MILTPDIVVSLAAVCARQAAPETLLAIARVESGLDPLAIGVNGAGAGRRHPITLADAVSQARGLIAGGANIDLGLGQINSANLKRLGLSVADAFDPCRNLSASATVVQRDYRAALVTDNDAQGALRVALSRYNTGAPDRGFRNGYVARVVAAATQLPAASMSSAPSDPRPAAAPAAWDVFGQVRQATFVLSPVTLAEGGR